MSFVCEAEKSEMTVCLCRCTEGAPGACQWCRTPVSDHLPSDNHDSTGELCFGDKKRNDFLAQ